jgi:hypothetical protein
MATRETNLSTFAAPFDPFQFAGRASTPHRPVTDPILALFAKWQIALKEEHEASKDSGLERTVQLGHVTQSLIDQIMATPATAPAGLAAKLELALQYSDFDPSGIDPEDYPWSIILAVIEELKAVAPGLAGTESLARRAES